MDPSDAAVTESAASTDTPSHHDPLPHHPAPSSRAQPPHQPSPSPQPQQHVQQVTHQFPPPNLRHAPPQPRQPPAQPRPDAARYPSLMLQGLSHPPHPHLESHRPPHAVAAHPPLASSPPSTSTSTSKLWQHFIKGAKMQKTNKFFAHCVYCRKVGRDSNTRGERRMMSAHLANCSEAPPAARAEALAISKDLKMRRSILSIGKKTRGAAAAAVAAAAAAVSYPEGITKRHRSTSSLHAPIQPSASQDAIVAAAAAAAAATPPHPQEAVAAAAAASGYFDPMGTPPMIPHELRDLTRSGHIRTNDNVRLYYEECGSGHPLILLHALAASCKYFESNFRELGTRFRVIRYDHRGHGDSEKPRSGHHVHRLAADLRDVMVHFHLEKVALLGCALGCAVIWAFVELYGPAQISAAMFVDQSPFPGHSADGSWLLGSKFAFSESSLAYRLAQFKINPRAFHEDSVRLGFTRQPSPIAISMCVDESLKCDSSFVSKLMLDVTFSDWREVLAAVSCPALVIAGKKSKISEWGGMVTVSDRMPHARLIPFEEGSHLLYIEESMRFNSTVAAFLQSIVSGGTG
eukprot:TRINITY_DN7776_c0_g1_i1.p1 TRINITY_DN7776_c0_g1~~TRINITY_DN7776_c0_g1_i1.p1  ORF type:complete len:575 (+),score=123.54 TRINITY_DN7776_c0_g1_i1:477-2201(+)